MNSYPEKIPQGITAIDKFPFSFAAGKTAQKNLESQLEQVNSRVNKIVEHFIYDDVPVLHFVLRATNQKSDLKKMAKAIDRLADLVNIQEDLTSRMNVLKLLEADPTWFTTTFSDYSNEIDQDLSNIIEL